MYDARFAQKKRNLRVGEIAKAKGWLSDDDVRRILIMQEDTLEKFGDIAVRGKYLSAEHLEELIKEQEDTYIFFGEALVLIGAITEKDLIEQLKGFNKAKFFTQDA